MKRAAGRPARLAPKIPETVSPKAMVLPIAIRLWMNGKLQVVDAQGSLVPELSGPWHLCIPVLLKTIPWEWIEEWTMGSFSRWMMIVSRSEVQALAQQLELWTDGTRTESCHPALGFAATDVEGT